MDALVANKFGSYEQVLEFQSIEVPVCAANDVLIQVAYTDLNPVDLQKLGGGNKAGQPVPDPPFVTGFGGSGTVQQVGAKGPQHLMGKKVVFLADPARRGSYASQIAVDGRCVAALPATVNLREAATIPVAGLTALECLMKLGLVTSDSLLLLHQQDPKLDSVGLESSTKKARTTTTSSTSSSQESLLIVGGSGGVGSWLITLARAYHPNLNIVATASTPESQAWCQQLGATQVMGHNEIAGKLVGGREGSVRHIICLTEPTPTLFQTLAEVVTPYGNIVLVVAGPSISTLDLGFCFFKCANVLTETVFSSIRTNYRTIVPANELTAILNLMEDQTITAPISPFILLLEQSEGILADTFQDALEESKGVLSLLANTNNAGRQGNLVMRIN